MIYFIQAADGNGPIKIGFANNPTKRVAEIQRMSPASLQVLRIIEGDRKLEGELHQYFYHLHQYGEWFEAGKEILDFIDNPTMPLPQRKRMTLRQAKREEAKLKNIAGQDLRELIEVAAMRRGLSMEKLAREADLSFRQFVTVVNGGITKGTRFGTIEKVAKVLDKEPSELIRLTVEE